MGASRGHRSRKIVGDDRGPGHPENLYDISALSKSNSAEAKAIGLHGE